MQNIDLVVKIGSMALIQKEDSVIDYNVFQRLAMALRPGMILVSSGATEIGRLDYIQRTGHELTGEKEQIKVDYSAQGQSILMNNYRTFIRPEYGVRQVLVEHTHFNDPQRREHIRQMLYRAAEQNAIPIINYNDPVNDEEVSKLELASRRAEGMEVVECVDNDETAAVVARLVHAKNLILLTGTHGIYLNKDDPSTLIPVIHTADALQLIESGVINGGMLPKVTCCIDAIRWGVHRVFIIDGRVPHAILIEMLTNEGIGTMFVAGQGGKTDEHSAT